MLCPDVRQWGENLGMKLCVQDFLGFTNSTFLSTELQMLLYDLLKGSV